MHNSHNNAGKYWLVYYEVLEPAVAFNNTVNLKTNFVEICSNHVHAKILCKFNILLIRKNIYIQHTLIHSVKVVCNTILMFFRKLDELSLTNIFIAHRQCFHCILWYVQDWILGFQFSDRIPINVPGWYPTDVLFNSSTTTAYMYL